MAPGQPAVEGCWKRSIVQIFDLEAWGSRSPPSSETQNSKNTVIYYNFDNGNHLQLRMCLWVTELAEGEFSQEEKNCFLLNLGQRGKCLMVWLTCLCRKHIPKWKERNQHQFLFSVRKLWFRTKIIMKNLYRKGEKKGGFLTTVS